MTLDRQVERARRHMEEHRAKHGDPMLDGQKESVDSAAFNRGVDYALTLAPLRIWWRRFIAWWRG